MGVSVSIELDQLRNPAVSQALADLMLALGNVSPQARAPRAARVVTQDAEPQAVKRAPARRRAAPKAPPKKLEGNAEQRYEAFFKQLPERSQRFLDLVKERGLLTIDEAMKALDITVPKAMGGITGSIGRWAPVRGVAVPYTAVMHKGQRAWRWVGSESTPAGDDATEGDLETVSVSEEFIESLPDDSGRFLRLLREHGKLSMREVLSQFNLARAKSVGGIIEPITRLSRAREIDAFVADTNDKGERIWLWPGFEPEVEVVATKKAPAPVAKKASDRPSGRPGVRVRKRM